MDLVLAKCERCNKKMRSFTVTYDWSKRRLHKSCWKKEQEDWSIKMMMEQYQKSLEKV